MLDKLLRAHGAKPPFPALELLDPKSQGQRAIDLLGARLPEVAAWYGKSADEFAALLLNDRRLKLDRRGRLFVEDEPDAAPSAAGAAQGSSVNDGTLQPLDQTFLLHSRPGAKRTIYLNFRGATLTSTAWNSSGTITALPFDMETVEHFAHISLVARLLGRERLLSRDEVARLQGLLGRYGIASPGEICIDEGGTAGVEGEAVCQVVQAPHAPGQRLVAESFAPGDGPVSGSGVAEGEIRLTYRQLAALIEEAVKDLR